MEERLGVIVHSQKTLQEKLKAFLDGEEHIEDLYCGRVKRNKGVLAPFVADEETAQTIDCCISKGTYGKLLDLWVNGLSVDWNRLYGDSKPRRLSLPTYPFARERYWINSDPLGAHPPKKILLSTDSKEIKSDQELGKSIGLTLAPTAMPSTPFFAAPRPLEKRLLKPLDPAKYPSAMKQEELSGGRSICVNLYDYGGGILCIHVEDGAHQNLLSKEVVSGLVESFRMIRSQRDAKVVLLKGEDRFFLSGGVPERKRVFEQKIIRLSLDCELPVMAVMKGQSRGIGWLVGSVCDFMVCSEESLYQVP